MRANLKIIVQSEGVDVAKANVYEGAAKPPNPYVLLGKQREAVEWERGWVQGLVTWGERKRKEDEMMVLHKRHTDNVMAGITPSSPIQAPLPQDTYRIYRMDSDKIKLIDTFTGLDKARDKALTMSTQYCHKFSTFEIWHIPWSQPYSMLPTPGCEIIYRCILGVAHRVPSMRSFVTIKHEDKKGEDCVNTQSHP